MQNTELSNSTNFSTYIKSFGKNFSYLVSSMPLGILYFTLAVTGISLGIGTSIIYIGIPIIAATLILTRKFVDFDKMLAAKILNISLPQIKSNLVQNQSTEGIVKRLIAIIKSPKNWASIPYCLLRLPIGILHFTISICLTTLSLGLILCPVFYGIIRMFSLDLVLFNSDVFNLLGIYIPQSGLAFIYLILGLGIGYLTLKVIYLLAQKSAKATLNMFK